MEKVLSHTEIELLVQEANKMRAVAVANMFRALGNRVARLFGAAPANAH